MSIARQGAELLHATMSAESEPGQGARFIVELPVNFPAMQSSDQPLALSESPSAAPVPQAKPAHPQGPNGILDHNVRKRFEKKPAEVDD